MPSTTIVFQSTQYTDYTTKQRTELQKAEIWRVYRWQSAIYRIQILCTWFIISSPTGIGGQVQINICCSPQQTVIFCYICKLEGRHDASESDLADVELLLWAWEALMCTKWLTEHYHTQFHFDRLAILAWSLTLAQPCDTKVHFYPQEQNDSATLIKCILLMLE